MAIGLVGVLAVAGSWVIFSALLGRLGDQGARAPGATTVAAPPSPATPGPTTPAQPTATPTPTSKADPTRMSKPTPVPVADRPVPSLPPGGPHRVRFEVWGTGTDAVDILLNTDEPDEREYSQVELPWAVEADVDPDIELLIVEVYGYPNRPTPLSCRITVDGIVVAESVGRAWAGCWIDVPSTFNK